MKTAAIVLLGVTAMLGAADAWTMPVVTMYHTRFLGNNPHSFNTSTKKWQAQFELSTANTASLLGSLQYAQEEVLPEDTLPASCQRRSNANLIVFYEIQFVQPNATLGYYNHSAGAYETPYEYGRYYAIDGGAATPGQDWAPQLWNGSYAGQKLTPEAFGNFSSKPVTMVNNPPLGNFIGGQRFPGIKAVYPENYWFSLPADCTMNTFAYKKAPICSWFPSGLCKGEYGTAAGTPDGVKCTWNFKTMGVVDVNGLVGMYDIVEKTGNATKDYQTFCNDKNNAYKGVFLSRDCSSGSCKQTGGFPFFANYSDPQSNTERAKKVMEYYANTTANPNNFPLLSAKELRAKNPKCYETSQVCTKNSCFRNEQQICEPCRTEYKDLCESVPQADLPALTFPAIPKPADGGSSANGTTDGSGNGSGSGAEGSDSTTSSKSSSSALYASAAVSAVSVLTAAAANLF